MTAQASRFHLIIVGDEILSGKRQDKHLSKAIELLAERGLELSGAEYVGDDPQRITAVVKRAFDSGDIVFSTGGIGATPDDHTRQCAAKALSRELALHGEAADLIRERMRDVAKENGMAYEPDRPDNIHRLNMGMFPTGAEIIPNPYNKIAGFSIYPNREELSAAGPPQGVKAPSGGSAPREAGERGGIHFFPGFPVMAWPMMEWVLDTKYKHLHRAVSLQEKSVIVMGAMEATLTPLMEQIEAAHQGIKVFSLPSVDHPQYGRHIELGVKGLANLDAPYLQLLAGLKVFGVTLGPELTR